MDRRYRESNNEKTNDKHISLKVNLKTSLQQKKIYVKVEIPPKTFLKHKNGSFHLRQVA